MVDRGSPPPGFYEMLQVHPAAPLDLITAAYWRLANSAREAGDTDRSTAVFLHQLTRAYQILADPRSRADYDRTAGIPPYPPAPRVPHFQRNSRGIGKLFGKRSSDQPRADVDYYEILRVDSSADPAVITEARDILRKQYVRLVLMKEARPELLDFLEEAHAVTTDPLQRAAYDARRAPKAAKAPAAEPGPAGAPTPLIQPAPPPKTEAPPAPGQAPARVQQATHPPAAPEPEQAAGAQADGQPPPMSEPLEQPAAEAQAAPPDEQIEVEEPPAEPISAAAEPETGEVAPPAGDEPDTVIPAQHAAQDTPEETAPVPSEPREPVLPKIAAIVAPLLASLGRVLIAAAILGGRMLLAGLATAWQGARWFAALCVNALLSATDSLADRWVRRRKSRIHPDDEKLLIDRLSRVTDAPVISSDAEGRSLGEVRSVRGE